MFRGDFGDNNSNIVHETVNLFKADDGNHYLYIPPYGKLKDSEKFSHVLVVTDAGTNKTKVKYIAEISVFNHINSGDILYNNTKLYDIFNDNFYKGEKDNQTVFVTYKVNKIYRPINDIIFTQNINETDYTYITCTKTQKLYQKFIDNTDNKNIIINTICNNEWEEITDSVKTLSNACIDNNPIITEEVERIMAKRFFNKTINYANECVI
jgi:hypothetical protein